VLSSRISNHALAYSQTMLPSVAQPSAPIARAQTAPVSGLTRVPHATPAPVLSTRPSQPDLVLPPYVPAPNLGDPAEQDATIPVDKMEFTELVDRYDPIVLDPAGRLRQQAPARDSIPESTPRGLDLRAVGAQILRYWPMIMIAAIVLVFLGGYLAFDDSGSRKRRPASEPATATEPAKPRAVEAVQPTANTADANTGDARPADAGKLAKLGDDAKPADASKPADATRPADVAGVAEPAKPKHGKLYIPGDRSVQIYLNGRSANRVAPAQLSLPPGNHKLTLWNQSTGKTTTQWVTIVAGETVVAR
jgi:hypothetical protein